jgi:hypothetical protein
MEERHCRKEGVIHIFPHFHLLSASFHFYDAQYGFIPNVKVNYIHDCVGKTLPGLKAKHHQIKEEPSSVKFKSGSHGLEYNSPYNENHHKAKHCLQKYPCNTRYYGEYYKP